MMHRVSESELKQFVCCMVCDADRYVIIGNHYDAFVLGALDPNSGTAIMLELSRAFALLQKQGQLFPVYIGLR